MQRIPLIILRLPFSDNNFILTFQLNKFNKKCSGQKSFALSIYGLSKMEKDIVGKNSNDIFSHNENSTIKKYVTDYNDKILHASSPVIAIKNKKLQLPKVCSVHSKGKKQIQLAIQKTLN